MRKIVSLILSVLVTLFPSSVLFSDPLLEARLEPEKLGAGSSATLIIDISWPQTEGNYKFALPEITVEGASSGRFGEAQETYLKEDAAWIKKSFRIEIRPQKSGRVHVNSFPIPYVKEEAAPGTGAALTVPAFTLEVEDANNRKVFYGAAAAFFLAILGLTFFIVRRRKKIVPAAAFISEEDLTVRKIQDALQKLKDENVKDIIKKISDEFILFLAGRYKITETKHNEKVMLENLKKRDVPAQEWQRIAEIFDDIYKVRYAGMGEGQKNTRYIAGEITAYINSKRILGTPS